MKTVRSVPRGTAIAFLAAALCAAAAGVPASATCGSANCFLVTGTEEGVGSKGSFTFDLSYRYIVQSRRLRGDDGVPEVLTPKVDFENGVIEPDHHREIRTQNTLVQLDLAYAASDRLTVSASLPLINDRDHEHFDDVGTANETFTRQDGSQGFGDVRLGARYAFLVRTKNLIVGSLALKIPTGQYRLRDSEGAINEPTIQPGTGSTDVVAGVYYAHQWIPMRFESFVSAARRTNGENDLDYRFGAEDLWNAGVDYSPGEKVTWALQINVRRTSRDTYRGDLVPSTGATFVNLTPGARFHLSTTASFYAFAQVPVYQHVNDSQIAPRTGLLLGLSKSF